MSSFVYLEGSITDTPDLATVENRAAGAADLGLFPAIRYGLLASKLEARMLTAEMVATLSQGYVSSSPLTTNYNQQRQDTIHAFLCRRIGCKKRGCTAHVIMSYRDFLARTECDVESRARNRRILFVGFVGRMKSGRLPRSSA